LYFLLFLYFMILYSVLGILYSLFVIENS